jgi:hypothetical protein
MHDGKTHFVIQNPVGRYLINSSMFAKPQEERRGFTDNRYVERVAWTG